ncbi:lysis protein [Citrobacter phage Citrof5]
MLELLKRLAPAIVLVLAFSFGMYVGSVTKDNEWKEEVHNEYVTKNEARASTQREVDAVSKKYQEDYAALEGSTDGVIDELSRDNKRLRANACAPGSARGSNGRCESYVSVELHESTVKSLVRITESADLKERALQDTIRKLQNKQKER